MVAAALNPARQKASYFYVWSAAFLLGALTVFPALGQAGNAVEGRRLSLSVCSNCHLVPESQRPTAMDAAPTFVTIATDPAFTDVRLRRFLNQPHGQMPPIVISRGEIEDLIAYLRAVRRTPR
jgi:mono/diheme cytochrome c family protein